MDLLAYAIGCAQPAAPPPAAAPVPQAAPGPAVASGRCAGCHDDIVATWRGSAHAQAEGPVRPGMPAAPPDIAPIAVIGRDPVVQWLVPADRGRVAVYDPAFDPRDGSLFSIHATPAQPGTWAHWTGRGMSWNTQCAACHNTGLVKGYDAEHDAFATTFVERGVGCSACHGGQGAHADGGPVAPLDRMADACAPCHSRRTELTGAFAPGDAFLDHFAPALVDLSDTFRPDGGVQAEDFEWTAFLGSRMHAAGVRCVDCHEPHGGGLRAAGDAVCASCHGGTPDHDHHTATTCVDCHMPTTTYMARDVRHDHGFTVPDPALTVSHDVPSACDRCHGGATRASAEAAAAWWGPPDRPSQIRARALADARRGLGPDAVLAVATTDPLPAWRAMALGWLDPWVGQPDVELALQRGLHSPDPLARFAAAGTRNRTATGSAEVAALRGDPVRAVRIEASRAERHRFPVDAADLADYRDFLAFQADQPTHLAEHAAWRLERGDVAGAVVELRRANGWDPEDTEIARALAIALSRQGDHAGAAEILAMARSHTDSADLAFSHGLALAAGGRKAEAQHALRSATDLDPQHLRAWINLALLAHAEGDLTGALRALDRAADAAPQDPEVPTTRAALLRDAGRVDEARQAAQQALALRPDHGPAQALLRSLGAAKR